jgi:acetylglutamate kinase
MQQSPTVIKIGGALLQGGLDIVWKQIGQLLSKGPVVVVHGGGGQCTELSRMLGHEPEFVHGRRITTALDLKVLQWAIRGEISSAMVAAASTQGIRAVGISGADASTVVVRKRPTWSIDQLDVDFGYVGDVAAVNPEAVDALLGAGIVPVVAPIGVDDQGGLFNVNADTVAIELAVALSAKELVFLSDTGGVVAPGDTDGGSVLFEIDHEMIARGIDDGWISDGMRMKMEAAIDGIHRGISSVRITDVKGLTASGKGTRIREVMAC